MFGIGGTELFFIFVIVLLLFGAKRVPEIARSFGKASREFKKAKNDIMDYSEKVIEDAEKEAAVEEDKTVKMVARDEAEKAESSNNEPSA